MKSFLRKLIPYYSTIIPHPIYTKIENIIYKINKSGETHYSAVTNSPEFFRFTISLLVF